MNKLHHAQALAEYGFYVFPLVPDSKLPLIDGWQRKASRDVDRINAWWTCPVMEAVQDYNIGIYTGRFKGDKALLVVDVDVKNGKDGNKALNHLLGTGRAFDTVTSLTPTGGRHLIFIVDKAVKSSAGTLGEGLDVRSHGGFIVAPGSVVPAGEYRWE